MPYSDDADRADEEKNYREEKEISIGIIIIILLPILCSIVMVVDVLIDLLSK